MEYLNAFHAWVTPAPINPLFQKGGYFEGYNEDLTLVGLFVLMFAILDFVIVRNVFRPKSWYFVLHIVCNSIVCYCALPDVLKVLTGNPLEAFTGPYASIIPNSISAGLHLYHCLAFKLRPDDIFHHVTFVIFLCGLGVPYKNVGGASSCFGGFFLSGLPGGLDYILLVLVDHGYMAKATEKAWYTSINVWLRGPSQSVYLFMMWLTRYHLPHYPVPLAVSIVAGLLHFYNGQFYTQQACESNALFLYKNKLEAQGIVIPEPKKETKKKQ